MENHLKNFLAQSDNYWSIGSALEMIFSKKKFITISSSNDYRLYCRSGLSNKIRIARKFEEPLKRKISFLGFVVAWSEKLLLIQKGLSSINPIWSTVLQNCGAPTNDLLFFSDFYFNLLKYVKFENVSRMKTISKYYFYLTFNI